MSGDESARNTAEERDTVPSANTAPGPSSPGRSFSLAPVRVLPHVTQETVQRVPPTSQSRREFSIRGLPLDHATQPQEDLEGKPQAVDVEDVAAVGAADLGGAQPSDGLPPPLQYSGKFGRGCARCESRGALVLSSVH